MSSINSAAEIKTLQKQLTDAEKELQTKEAAHQKLDRRIAALTERQAEISGKIAALRGTRKGMLVDEKDTSGISLEIRGFENGLELLKDEFDGLQEALSEMIISKRALSVKVDELKRGIASFKTIEAAREYNKIAAQLAEVLKTLDEAIDATCSPDAGGKIYTAQGAGVSPMPKTKLPIVYIRGESEKPLEITDATDIRASHWCEYDHIAYRKHGNIFNATTVRGE